MNLIKNFFHAFGDIILGLIVVGIAVFLIGTQINSDFDVYAIGIKAYDTAITKISGEKPPSEPSEILSDPSDASRTITSNEEGSELDAENSVKNTSVDNVPVDSEDEKSTKDVPAVTPENVPAIRNIAISAGSTADQVASGLFANGIIGTKEEFLAEYARLPVGRSIGGGNFQIPSGSTPVEILAIIAPIPT